MTDGIVEVTQADREAAASVHASRHLAACITDGEMDGNNVVQAFARHRLAALPAEPDEVTSEMIEAGMDAADMMANTDNVTALETVYLAMRAARPAANRSGGA